MTTAILSGTSHEEVVTVRLIPVMMAISQSDGRLTHTAHTQASTVCDRTADSTSGSAQLGTWAVVRYLGRWAYILERRTCEVPWSYIYAVHQAALQSLQFRCTLARFSHMAQVGQIAQAVGTSTINMLLI